MTRCGLVPLGRSRLPAGWAAGLRELGGQAGQQAEREKEIERKGNSFLFFYSEFSNIFSKKNILIQFELESKPDSTETYMH